VPGPASDDPRRKLTERYDREARAYRDLWAPVLRPAGQSLIRELRGVPGLPVRRVLDVGTGVGSLLPYLEATFAGSFVTGVDRSRGMLALAPAGPARAVMDAGDLAVASESVDLVLLAFLLFHLPRPGHALSEARRVLRPGGALGTLTWAREMDSAAGRAWTDCLDAHGAPVDPTIQARHDLVDTPGKMETLLRAAGFASVRSGETDLVRTIGLEHLLEMKTSVGSSRPRFDGLAPAARTACLAGARRRMEGMAPEDFVARGRVVHAIAVR
jgi:ubiquinone/menaquinone biosynthesis C-methylase UbiE